MLLTSFRRSSRKRFFRAALIAFLFLCALDFFSLVSHHARQSTSSNPSATGEKIFIASIHWNNELVLRSNWTRSVVALAKHLGPANVYVSVYESGSWDDSKGALRQLDEDLDAIGVQRSIILEKSTHLDEINKPITRSGWIETPRGQKELRRIPYLARLRNLSLRPLRELAENGKEFDKVLFLNDVVFTTQDVLSLLHTRSGSYAAACSLDFSKPPNYYDTFALRDVHGHEPATSTFPYFRSKASRSQLLTGNAVPLQSCWNGMVAMPASPFVESAGALKFRGLDDSLAERHLEASECCLLHYDNPLTEKLGVWLNPAVRVGYSSEAYDGVHSRHVSPDDPTATSSADDVWPSFSARLRGLWVNRLQRWIVPVKFKEGRVKGQVQEWMTEGEGRSEAGVNCIINEMHVLVENGWAHV